MIVLLTRSCSFVDRVFVFLRSRLLTEPRIHHPDRPSDDAPRMLEVVRLTSSSEVPYETDN
jgi:hypothetical protein